MGGLAPLTIQQHHDEAFDVEAVTKKFFADFCNIFTKVTKDDGSANMLLEEVLYKDRDFVLIDESHNLRHPDTQRYKVVEVFLSTGRRSCFLTAT